MSNPLSQDQIDTATAYESPFVPALFRQWATKVADAAQIRSGQRGLDVACGTGVLAREVASRVNPTGYVAGLDPSPGMLAVGNELARAIDWKQGAAEALPFADESFNTIVSQFGLMFFSDRRQAIREMLRVLIPGGHIVVAGTEEQIGRLLQEAGDVLRPYVTAEGPVVFESPAHIVMAMKTYRPLAGRNVRDLGAWQ